MPSREYLEALAESSRHHQESKTFSGSLALHHTAEITALVKKHDVRTILDYGCGKGLQYRGEGSLEVIWGAYVTKYDPAWPEFAAEPVGTFDLVICTHALGCIPLKDLPEIVERIYGYARKVVYVGEMIGPVKKRIFGHPERFAYGWSTADWERLLARPSSSLDIALGTFESTDPTTTVSVSNIGKRL